MARFVDQQPRPDPAPRRKHASPTLSRLAIAGMTIFALGVQACIDHQDANNDRRTKAPDVPVQAPAAVSGPAPASAGFAAMQSVVRASCGGGACHGPGSTYGVLTEDEAALKQKAVAIDTRVRSGAMPVPGSGHLLSPDNKTKLLNYVKALATATTNPAPVQPPPGPPPGPAVDPNVTTSKLPENCNQAGVTRLAAGTLIFKDTIDPILNRSCTGGGCHGPGVVGRQLFVGNEAIFKANGRSVISYLNDQANPMPRPPGKITDAERTKLLQFLCPLENG